jgi:hypothetical protein
MKCDNRIVPSRSVQVLAVSICITLAASCSRQEEPKQEKNVSVAEKMVALDGGQAEEYEPLLVQLSLRCRTSQDEILSSTFGIWKLIGSYKIREKLINILHGLDSVIPLEWPSPDYGEHCRMYGIMRIRGLGHSAACDMVRPLIAELRRERMQSDRNRAAKEPETEPLQQETKAKQGIEMWRGDSLEIFRGD